ncbi:hypothetical protein [Stenotrophomonas acidaminiphila]|uniref:hypothetical protein n=1 Tax=Stenotrophomonas acidaminiphila TaxID=128780 RepID=UPI0028B0CD1B|nr:hypothetical protein [Stenotrophomonas acidaminiphila]
MADMNAIEWEAPSAELDRALRLADQPDAPPADLHAALRLLRTEVLLRWQQRTALSFRLQDLRAALAQAGIDDQSTLYQRLHDVTATAEGWMHPGTLGEAVQAHIGALRGLLTRPPTEDMRIAGFESEAWDALSDAAVEHGGWPYSCAESAECCAGIFKAMAAAGLRGIDATWIGMDLASGPDVHVEEDIVDGQVAAVRVGSPGRNP